MDFRTKLLLLMQTRGETTREVGTVVGLDHSSVARWLKGARPRQSALPSLAAHYGVSLEVLRNNTLDLPTDAHAKLKADFDVGKQRYPDDPDKAQLAGDAKHFERLYREGRIRAGAALRKRAAVLRDLAQEMEEEALDLEKLSETEATAAELPEGPSPARAPTSAPPAPGDDLTKAIAASTAARAARAAAKAAKVAGEARGGEGGSRVA